MKSRPILFSAPMVHANLEGRKTQTRRVVKPQPLQRGRAEDIGCHGDLMMGIGSPTGVYRLKESRGRNRAAMGILNEYVHAPYGVPGDELWVKETHQLTTDARGFSVIVYQADNSARFLLAEDNGEGDIIGIGAKADRSRCLPVDRWRPSIHMHRKYSRLTLRVLSVRVERLQDISEADCKSEGITERAAAVGRDGGVWFTEGGERFYEEIGYRVAYRQLWESINGPGSWEANLWVWVVGYERVKAGA